MFNLTWEEISHFLFAMSILLAMAHILGFIAERLFIPRVIGEVTAGLILGPSVLGYVYPNAFEWLFLGFEVEEKMFGLLYQIGLLLLIFGAGLKFQSKFEKGDGIITAALVIGSTVPAFIVGWLATHMFYITPYLGTANNVTALKIIIAVSIAITSIPVISKIMFDLGIIHSRFSKIVISVAGIHDIFLWTAVGVATAIASEGSGAVSLRFVFQSIGITVAFIIGSILALTFLFKRLTIIKQNLLFRSSNLGYFLFVMFILAVIAGKLNIETIFGALIAGIAIKIALPNEISSRVEQGIANISFSWFIPVYFATVGL